MSEHGPHTFDAELSGGLDDLRGLLADSEQELELVPDAADLHRRIAEQIGGSQGARHLDEAGRQGGGTPSGELLGDLVDFARDLASVRADEAAQQDLAPVPPLRAVKAAGFAWGTWLGRAAAVALICGGGLALWQASGATFDAQTPSAYEAEAAARDGAVRGLSMAPQPVPPKYVGTTTSGGEAVEVPDAQAVEVLDALDVEEAAPVEDNAPEVLAPAEPEPERPKTPAKAKKVAESPEAKAKRARSAWKSGDRKSAERLLLEVARGGKGQVAEFAFADLFALARQRGGVQAVGPRWREYLRRFPGGRFSDDARAGLCRLASAERAAACWGDYLARHPGGAYESEARKALVAAKASPSKAQ